MVVVDSATGEIDSYGPLGPDAAERMVADLRELLDATGVGEVHIAVGRLYAPDGRGHPEDP